MDDNNYKKGLVSIGLPTYNRPENLEKALKHIINQTYKNLEIIVSDNASPNSKVEEIIEKYSLIDSRVKYYKQQNNIGVLANAEFVLQQSIGEYFTWFSDDDWRSREFIESMVTLLENNKNLNMAFCDYHEVYEDGSLAFGYPQSHLNIFKPFQSQHRLVRIISYYWQKSINGKCNIFYSVFRKKALDTVDIKKITEGYELLNMDSLITFKLLQQSPIVISDDPMCSLTCGNQKYYTDNTTKAWRVQKSTLKKVIELYKSQKKDRNLYIKNTSRFVEKFLIYLLFNPKYIFETCEILYFKIQSIFRKFCYKKQEKASSFDSKLAINQTEENKLKLPNVTIVAVATRHVEETLQAILYSCREIEFGSIKLLSHFTPFCKDDKIEFIRIEKMKNIDDWSHFIVYELNKHIETEFILLVHADGFVVNPTSWRMDFLNYDYIGAPWPLPSDNFSYRDINGQIVRVGNSVSLRSKKLLELPTKLNIPWEADHGYYNEDGFLCVKNKHIFEANGIRFAPLEVAKYFAHESMIPEIRNIKPFVFHKWVGSNSGYPKFIK
jgi:glycosyltransferase involved in cell wall biosynthesis